MIAAAPQRRLPVRVARGGCVLVRREAVTANGFPDERLGQFAFAEWSQRVLGDQHGYLLPAARAVRVGDDHDGGWRELPPALRAVRRGGWGAGGLLRALAEVFGR